MNNTEYSNNKYKQKMFPVLSLSKTKYNNEIKFSNRSLNSMTYSEYNSESNTSKKQKYSKNSYTNSDQSVKPYKT